MVLNRKCRAWHRAALGRTGREVVLLLSGEGGFFPSPFGGSKVGRAFPLPGERVRERG